MFNRVAILGVGLIGGSVAAAVKRFGVAREVIGYSPFDGQEAFRLGLIDGLAVDANQAVNSADLVVVATPPSEVAAMIGKVLPVLSNNAVVTDVSSVKGPVVRAVREVMGTRFEQFVSSHPIAGAETSGPSAARADLFERAQVVINPGEPKATLLVTSFWERLGARVTQMQVQEHDEIYAAVSHLPHAVAFALCLGMSRHPLAEKLGSYGAGGLRDTSRVGASSASLWTNILLENAAALAPLLESQARALQEVSEAIASGDETGLRRLIERGGAWRRAL
jgi:prephenate dehydrogenase